MAKHPEFSYLSMALNFILPVFCYNLGEFFKGNLRIENCS